MKDLLDRLSKAVGALAEVPAEVVATPGPEDMSLEAFTVYVTEELEKAAKDTPETKVLRLKALAAQIEIAKNFEGRPATPGGILRVTRFQDPGQVRTTEKTTAPGNASATTQFTAGAETHPPGMPSTPPGGKMPPITAGGSGFATPASATFAKALEALTDQVLLLEGKTPEEIAKAKADAKVVAEAAAKVAKANDGKSPEEIAKAAEATKIAKAKADEEAAAIAKSKETDAFWPLDMNTDFGMGKTKDPDVPEWGLDHGKAPAATAPAAKPAE